MTLYLVHHGDAVPPELDPQRPLSARGESAVDEAATAAASRGAKFQVVWHSGKLRARQTAEAFWRRCNPLAELSASRGLQPTDPPEWIQNRLAGETRNVMVVGHMPNLERLLRLLLAGNPDAPGPSFPAHGVVALERAPDGWREVWRITAAG